MKQLFRLLILLSILALIRCKPHSGNAAADTTPLSKSERAICDTLQIDSTVISDIREYNSSAIAPFPSSPPKMINETGKETEAGPVAVKGLMFTEKNSKSYSLIFALQKRLLKKGYSIFLYENNFDFNKKPDDIVVLKTTDKYAVLKQIETDGINYDIDNDSLISIIKRFDKKYDLQLIGASYDWCEFAIRKEPGSWSDFAKEVYKVCPDVVDQGAGTLEALENEMRQKKRLYFWWD
jgi:hypothetical protein